MPKQDELYQTLLNALEQQDVAVHLATIDKINSATVALVIQNLTIEQQAKILEMIPQAAYILEFFPISQQVTLAEKLNVHHLAELISEMHSDERTDLYKALPNSRQQEVFKLLSQDKQEQIKNLVTYAEQSAGSIMSSDYVSLSSELNMQQAIEQLRRVASDRETLYLIYITNDEKRLEGVISLRQIIQSDPNTTIANIMTTDLVVGRFYEDQEQVAKIIDHYDFIALPIVDDENRLLGIVTYDDAMDVLQEEFTEDALKGGAIGSNSTQSLKSAPILSLYRQRVFWLVILVFGSLLSGIGIAHYEDIISAHIVLVFFLPLLVGSGGNAGSQSATLMVRAIATGDVDAKDWFKLLGRESLVAGCLGGTMAVAVSVLGFIRGDEMVALVLAISMMGIVMMGCLIGMSLPFILNKLGLDPASASAPLVTSICDATGVIIYLFIASKLLMNFT